MVEPSPNGPWNSQLGDINEDVVHAILELVSDGVWDWNANTGLVYRSPGWYEMLGYAPNTLPNSVFTWENVIHPDDYPLVMAHFDDHLNERTLGYHAEYRCRTRSGAYILIEDRGYVIDRNPDGSVARMIGAHRSLEDQRRLLEQLAVRTQSFEAIVAERTAELSRVNRQLQAQVEENRRLAESDSLTGAANRYCLEKILLRECQRAERFRQPLSLIAMDIDDFKLINDSHGHQGGDTVLVEVAQTLQSCLRDTDLLARWGGDEFMIVLPHSTIGGAMERAQQMRERLLQHKPLDLSTLTISFGVVERCADETMTELMSRADQALYRAKGIGKNVIAN